MSVPTPAPDPADASICCAFQTIVGNLTPFYLVAAGGSLAAAAQTILDLIRAYQPHDAAEIELAGRIVGLCAAAADSLRASMRAGLSDTKVLRYRGNAVALERAAEKTRAALAVMQQQRHEHQPPEPAAAPDPRPATADPSAGPADATSRPANAPAARPLRPAVSQAITAMMEAELASLHTALQGGMMPDVMMPDVMMPDVMMLAHPQPRPTVPAAAVPPAAVASGLPQAGWETART